jgi:uncharacterized protein YndB with AHSA1/START domain
MTDRIIITRTFDAPRELVWAAWTSPEQFAVWFGSDAVDVPVDSVHMDVRVGGAWAAEMHLPDGKVIHWAGEFTEVDPPARLGLTMTDDPSSAAREPITVTLAEVAGGTEMTMTQSGENLPPEQIEGTREGWNTFFDSMAVILTNPARQ